MVKVKVTEAKKVENLYLPTAAVSVVT